MIKIAATISKKIPLPGIDYSSQSYGASMEVEISDADKPEAIKQRINELYGLLSQTIDEQLSGSAPQQRNSTAVVQQAPVRALPAPVPQQPQPRTYNGQNRLSKIANGNGRVVVATQAQCRAIFAISKAQGLDLAAVLANYNVTDASQLHVKDASQLIDQLKASQNGQPAQ